MNEFNPWELWPFVVLLALAAFAFCLLGPMLSGLLLLLVVIVVTANLVTPH
jgi:hypothetical protein